MNKFTKMSPAERKLHTRLHGLKIRNEMLRKCETEYEGWAQDLADNEQQIQELREQLQEAA